EIATRFPDYAELIEPKPATIEAARAVLRPGEALIATYVGEERTYVWAIPKRGEVSFAAVDIGREELEDTVEWLRAALEPNATTLGDIPDFDLGVAHALYKKLLEPVKAGWRDAESLLVVAHGALGYLPLSLLPTGPAKLGPEKGALFANYRDVPWLVRTHAVTMLPSVASLKTLRGLPPGPAGRKAFVGFGDPYFSRAQAEAAARETAKPVQVASLAGRGLQSRGLPVRLRAAPATQALDSAELARLPRLPDTADEIRSIAVALKADLTRDVFLGERANEGAVKTLDLSGYKVLAFATHGLVPGDLNGLVQPALALSAPEVAGGKDDGLLTMGEILGLKLNADWVVLSACNTGSGQGAGAEAVSGLGRAFFYAGTRALLVSNWPVETTSAKALTTDLFKRQAADATLTRTQALRAAMLALIDGPGYVDQASGKAVFSYAHPIFWAPFTLIGDGGGARPGA
ncbi:MAG: CHAT domain-containing protein, partial [Proteobacteria bacterium]|nr:CHAT domain-containing protein [Pseudomonadota bacterium]